MPHCYTAKSHTLRQVRLSLGAGYSKSLCKVSNPSNPTRQFHCAVQSEAQYHSYPDPISCYVWYFVFASCTKSPVNSKNTGFQSNKEAAWLDIVHKHRQTNPLWIWSNWPPRSAAAIALQGLSCWAQTSQQFDPAPAIGTSVSDETACMYWLQPQRWPHSALVSTIHQNLWVDCCIPGWPSSCFLLFRLFVQWACSLRLKQSWNVIMWFILRLVGGFNPKMLVKLDHFPR